MKPNNNNNEFIAFLKSKTKQLFWEAGRKIIQQVRHLPCMWPTPSSIPGTLYGP